MKKLMFILAVVAVFAMTACSKYRYETVKGDPTKTRIYTLENGLKVYMSVNKEAPRLQTMIAVKVGSKNDPIETTGLAHYFEHLMFKGTEQFGTMDFEAEKPLLDEIEALYEVYRSKSDESERKAIYHQIDSVSQLASKIAIPNEYDKLMQTIGASGTNAWTSYDETNYIEDIPSNQIENWAKIQADRFCNSVIRIFHTELETVYEEYNMSLTRDSGKAFEKLLGMLYPNHPYGQHSVLGFQEHLKNPSITNIKNYYKTFYVPNNMAICLAGDFDMDKTIRIIDKYFGSMQPNENLPAAPALEMPVISEPQVSEVYGLESEKLFMAWPAPGASSYDSLVGQIAMSVLSNGKCGILDTELQQTQKVLGVFAGQDDLADAGVVYCVMMPKQGQTLEQLRDLALEQLTKLRAGNFDENILSAIVNNFKKDQMAGLESNFARANMMESAFINSMEWKDVIMQNEMAGKITKDEVVAWANRYLPENGYCLVYKRQGEDKSVKKIDKPEITPISANRDSMSQFLSEMQQAEVEPIAPRFVDYERDMARETLKPGMELLYKKNETNGLFDLIYLFDKGSDEDPALDVAASYMSLLGTESRTLQQIQTELYTIACEFDVVSTSDRTYITISGLSENMDKAIEIAEDYISNLKGDEQILEERKRDILVERLNAKSSQRSCFNALMNWSKYGADYVHRTNLTNAQLMELNSQELVSRIKNLPSYEHKVMYYGPLSQKEVSQKILSEHKTAETLEPLKYAPAVPLATDTPKVTFSQYDAKQIYYTQYSCKADDVYDPMRTPWLMMFSEYFSGSMNAIVFQEMREARGLAYSASARYQRGSVAGAPYSFSAFIATQNDKMRQAIEAFSEIIEQMPRSETSFSLAKQGLVTNLATQRTTKMGVLWSYVSMKDMGMANDNAEYVYNTVKDITMDDVVDFQQKYIKGRKYNYVILGDRNDVDLKYLSTLGPVTFVSTDEIFGF